MDVALSSGSFSISKIKLSHHVMEVLDLEPRQQDRLMAVRSAIADMGVYDDVMLAARAWKEIHGLFFVKNLKFCYDEYDDTIYVLAFEALQPSFFCGYQVSVGTGVLHICQVKSIEKRKNSFREFIEILVTDKVCFMVRDIFIISFICFNLFRCFRILDIFAYMFFYVPFFIQVSSRLLHLFRWP